jgi:uroporphyrinogen decarboxylase
MKSERKPVAFLAPFERRTSPIAPIWMMRQAGRYLPEYRQVREKAGSFWTMCMTPDLAREVTLQPIRRFGFDAAILFSDILVIPFALGQEVRFEDGVGPRLPPLTTAAALSRDEGLWGKRLAPVYEALQAVRSELAPDKALIGFAGAPWTLAAYMLEGQGSPDQRAARLAGYRTPAEFTALLDLLADTVAWHLGRQIEAGADVVQIFDSWAGGLPLDRFDQWVVKPTTRIVKAVRAQHPEARIIGFPRATTQAGYEAYLATGVDAVGIDTGTSMAWAAKTLGGRVAVQGNLDPIALIAGGMALDSAIDRILGDTEGTPFIFNLGHGVLPETPLENVAQLVGRVRRGRGAAS